MPAPRTRSFAPGSEQTPAEALRTVAEGVRSDAAWDTYGADGLVAELEAATAAMLGKEAAVFAISGKTVQLAALRVHADARGRTAIAAHPRSHIVEDENDAIGALWGLRVARTGAMTEPFDRAALGAVAEPLAAVTVELPLRRAGYRVPPWDELVGIVDDAEYRGAAMHLDGARLWECAPYYERSLAEIADLADTVYVSFYKGLGGLAGGALCGDAATVAAVRMWSARAGCLPYRMTPYAASALAGLHNEAPRMREHYERAVRIAARVDALDGVTVAPNPPQSNAFVVHVAAAYDDLIAARDRVRERHGIDAFAWATRSPNPRGASFECVVTRAMDELTDDEIVAAVASLASG